MTDLAKQIIDLNQNLTAQLPTEIMEAFGKSIQDVKSKNIEEHSRQIGEKFPYFNLPNAANEMINLKELLKNGKLVIAFFRGNWCPYCNLQLKALQDNLGQITGKKATLIAISPQMPDYNASIKEKHQLSFEVLTDADNTCAAQLGITFALQDFVIPHYQNLGIDLSAYNGNEDNSLPVPAVFVVDTEGTILYRFVDTNYMKRVNIEELIEQL